MKFSFSFGRLALVLAFLALSAHADPATRTVRAIRGKCTCFPDNTCIC
jgi:hypothetical protein